MCVVAGDSALGFGAPSMCRRAGGVLPRLPACLHLGPSHCVSPGLPSIRRIHSVSQGLRAGHVGRESSCTDRACYVLSPDGQQIYVAGKDGKLHAVAVTSGEQRWVYECCQASAHSVAVSPDGATLFVVLNSGGLHAVAAQSGKQLWECGVDGASPRFSLLSSDGTSMFIATECGMLHAVNARDGERKWSHRVGEATPDSWSFAATPDNSSLLFWGGDGRLHALATSLGTPRWDCKVADAPPCRWGLAPTPDGSLVFFATADGKLHAVFAASGERRGCDLDGPIAADLVVLPDGARVLAATRAGTLHAVAAASGVEAWRYELGSPPSIAPVVSPDGACAFISCEDGQLHAVDCRSGKQRWFRGTPHAGRFSALVPDPHGASIFLKCELGKVLALDALSGEERWSVNGSSQGPLLLTPDGATALLGETAAGVAGVRSLVTSSGGLSWEMTPSVAAGRRAIEAAKAGGAAQVLEGNSALLWKRVTAGLLVVGVLEARRRGWLHRPPAAAEPRLEDVLGKDVVEQVLGPSGLVSQPPERLGAEIA